MRKNEREVLALAAEEGDALAAAMQHDQAEEDGPPAVIHQDSRILPNKDGLPPFWRPQRGDWVVIFTGMYFHIGQLLGEDHEYYCLAPGSEEVYETGPLEEFYRGEIKLTETVSEVMNIRKGPTVKLVRWPEQAQKARTARR